MQANGLPPPRGDPGHLLQQAVLPRPPRRRGGIEEVRHQPGGAQEGPAPHEGRPPRPVAQPEHHRGDEYHHEVGEVHPAHQHVPPVHALGVIKVALEPDRRHLTGEEPSEHPPIRGDQLQGVRHRAVVREPAGQVVPDQEQDDRAPIADEAEVGAPRPVTVPGDRRRPQPHEGVDGVGGQADDEPADEERHAPQGHADQPAAGEGAQGAVGGGGGLLGARGLAGRGSFAFRGGFG